MGLTPHAATGRLNSFAATRLRTADNIKKVNQEVSRRFGNWSAAIAALAAVGIFAIGYGGYQHFIAA